MGKPYLASSIPIVNFDFLQAFNKFKYGLTVCSGCEVEVNKEHGHKGR